MVECPGHIQTALVRHARAPPYPSQWVQQDEEALVFTPGTPKTRTMPSRFWSLFSQQIWHWTSCCPSGLAYTRLGCYSKKNTVLSCTTPPICRPCDRYQHLCDLYLINLLQKHCHQWHQILHLHLLSGVHNLMFLLRRYILLLGFVTKAWSLGIGHQLHLKFLLIKKMEMVQKNLKPFKFAHNQLLTREESIQTSSQTSGGFRQNKLKKFTYLNTFPKTLLMIKIFPTYGYPHVIS